MECHHRFIKRHSRCDRSIPPVDGEHEDLKSNMRRNGPYYDAPQSHATQTAGIACAVGNNGKGISGVSQICDLRSYTAKYFANLLSEMRSASTQARVVNISLGFGEKTLNTCLGVSSSGRKLDEMKRQLLAVVNFSPNTLWVAAAGNFCADANLSYPGALGALSDRVITVGATTRDDEWAPKSAYGGARSMLSRLAGGYKTVELRRRMLIACFSASETTHKHPVLPWLLRS